jgi:glycosyltransferase involved in cell wall biosynthesis
MLSIFEKCNPDKVSVIIPTYNYANFLVTAIESVLCQNHPDTEIIVVDDGSTDNTAELLDAYKNRIIYIYQNNAGLSCARNTGIDASSGEFILFLDADDILGPNTIKSHLELFTATPGCFISVCANKLFIKTNPSGIPIPTGKWRLSRQALDVHLCYFNIAPPHAFMIRRQVVTKTGLFDCDLKACEDYDFWLRAAANGFIPMFNSKGLVFYRRHSKSMSANLKNQTIHDAFLHHRLAKIIENFRNFPYGHRLEGILAFAAGAVKTSNRLKELGLEGSSDLLELVLEQLRDGPSIAKNGNCHWNPLTSLFYLRLVTTLKGKNFEEMDVKDEIFEALQKIVAATLGSRSSLKLFTRIIGHCLQDKRRLYFENREIQNHLIKFVIPAILSRH